MLPMIDPAACAGLHVLGELEPELLRRVLRRCHVATYSAGETILRLGAVNHHVHFLLSGEANVHFDIADQSQTIPIKVGQIFGEISVIDGMPVSAFVVASAPSRVLLLPEDVFWSEVVPAPGIAHTLMRGLVGLLRRDTADLIRAVQQRLQHEALERELGLARDIQMGMLRRGTPLLPDRPDIDIVALMRPAKLVGGDLYDAFLVDTDHVVLAIGDVTGKGMSAALFMVRVLTLLRSAAINWVSLADTVESVNRALASDNDASMFLTFFMGVLDLRTGELDYVNFGHPPPVIVRPDGAAAFHAISPGIVFGLFEAAKGAAGRLVLDSGSTLLLYTDGVTEAFDPSNCPFGSERLIETIGKVANSDPGAIVAATMAVVGEFAGAAPQADDITLLAVKFG